LRAEMIAALICRETGWTWQEYGDQPAWFIDVVLEMLKAESSAAARKAQYGKRDFASSGV